MEGWWEGKKEGRKQANGNKKEQHKIKTCRAKKPERDKTAQAFRYENSDKKVTKKGTLKTQSPSAEPKKRKREAGKK